MTALQEESELVLFFLMYAISGYPTVLKIFVLECCLIYSSCKHLKIENNHA